jgi:hypothetical protein
LNCEAHKAHRPEPTYLEYHHVIPQAWQKLWKPDGKKAVIWDPRTVALCRTGHGNVHYWLVKMMKTFADLSTKDAYVITPSVAVLLKGEKYVRREVNTAHLAMDRWVAAGGSLKALWDNDHFGEI